MRLYFILPTIYVLASFVFVFIFGGAGHSRAGEIDGIAIFYYISIPVALLDNELGFFPLLILGGLQYCLLGYLLSKLFLRKAGV